MEFSEKQSRRLSRLQAALSVHPALFVLRHGVLFWGLPVFVSVFLATALFGHVESLDSFLTGALMYSVGGIVFGIQLWFSFTRVMWKLEALQRRSQWAP